MSTSSSAVGQASAAPQLHDVVVVVVSARRLVDHRATARRRRPAAAARRRLDVASILLGTATAVWLAGEADDECTARRSCRRGRPCRSALAMPRERRHGPCASDSAGDLTVVDAPVDGVAGVSRCRLRAAGAIAWRRPRRGGVSRCGLGCGDGCGARRRSWPPASGVGGSCDRRRAGRRRRASPGRWRGPPAPRRPRCRSRSRAGHRLLQPLDARQQHRAVGSGGARGSAAPAPRRAAGAGRARGASPPASRPSRSIARTIAAAPEPDGQRGTSAWRCGRAAARARAPSATGSSRAGGARCPRPGRAASRPCCTACGDDGERPAGSCSIIASTNSSSGVGSVDVAAAGRRPAPAPTRCRAPSRRPGAARPATASSSTSMPGVGGDPADVLLQHVHRQQVELQVLGAAADRVADLLRIGGGQHEHDVRRRLLQRLQQRRLGRLARACAPRRGCTPCGGPGVPSEAFSMRSRIASTPLLLAASSSCTS